MPVRRHPGLGVAHTRAPGAPESFSEWVQAGVSDDDALATWSEPRVLCSLQVALSRLEKGPLLPNVNAKPSDALILFGCGSPERGRQWACPRCTQEGQSLRGFGTAPACRLT